MERSDHTQDRWDTLLRKYMERRGSKMTAQVTQNSEGVEQLVGARWLRRNQMGRGFSGIRIEV
jgi:hypothetical protein